MSQDHQSSVSHYLINFPVYVICQVQLCFSFMLLLFLFGMTSPCFFPQVHFSLVSGGIQILNTSINAR